MYLLIIARKGGGEKKNEFCHNVQKYYKMEKLVKII